MARSDWIWMAHPAHYILGNKCMFRLNTYVNGFIVSTVGECIDSFSDIHANKYSPIGSGKDDLYETAVYYAVVTDPKFSCCPFLVDHSKEQIECKRYKTANDATEGHYALCDKFDARITVMIDDEKNESKFNEDFPFGPVPPIHELLHQVKELKEKNKQLESLIFSQFKTISGLYKYMEFYDKELY